MFYLHSFQVFLTLPQAIARGNILLAETFEMRIHLLTLSLAKPT